MKLLADENLDLSIVARLHHGVILIRLAGLPGASKAALILQLVEAHRHELPGAFTVISPGMVRIRKRNTPM